MRRIAVVLAACVLSSVAALPVASAADGRAHHEFLTVYYASSSHTGTPVGRYLYGWCPDFFMSRTGTTTPYFTSQTYEC